MPQEIRRLTLTAGLFMLIACRGGIGDGEGGGETDPFLAELGYRTGLDSAPVTVVEFSDFGCPYCAQFALTSYPDLHAKFVLSGEVRWNYVPFVLGIFPNSEAATRAAECAAEQNRFWQMHDHLYQRQMDWRTSADPSALLLELALLAGVDEATFEVCYHQEDDEIAERIDRQNRLAEGARVRATPTFFVNGQMVEGALPAAQFGALLERALGR